MEGVVFMRKVGKVNKPKETSKKLLIVTCLLFTVTLITGMFCTILGKDTSLFMYAIPSTGTVFGATVVFYLNKAKMENIFKGREEFLKYKLDLLRNQPPELRNEIEKELMSLEDMLDCAINSETQEIITERITTIN